MATFEYSLHIDGRLTYFEDRILPLSNNELLSFIRDISDRVTSERQLVQAQKLEGVGTLAGGIAHEFNNLLAMIIGSAELLQQHVHDLPKLQKYVDRIIEASERGAAISKQLLIFSRPGLTELKQVSLPHSLTELQRMYRHILPASIEILIEAESDSLFVKGDAAQIHQALLNLVFNASDAMPNGGTLTLRAFSAAPETIGTKFGRSVETPYAAITVSDTGTGMDEQTMKKIFDPFFSTKEVGKGTGLGLAIVHGIVKNHNGFIDVVSTPGTGTSFTLYFPMFLAGAPAKEQAGAASHGRQAETVLVVDDEDILRDTLSEYLTDLGYSVYMAANGNEALKIYREHRSTIGIVITDLGMPEMGGEELYRCLRSIDDDVKVIVSSGYLDGPTKDRLLQMGIKEVITKPFKMNRIDSAVRSVSRIPQ